MWRDTHTRDDLPRTLKTGQVAMTDVSAAGTTTSIRLFASQQFPEQHKDCERQYQRQPSPEADWIALDQRHSLRI